MGNLDGREGKTARPSGRRGSRKRPHGSGNPFWCSRIAPGAFLPKGLAPGRYDMVLGPALDIVVPLDVPDEATGMIDVGTIVTGNKGS